MNDRISLEAQRKSVARISHDEVMDFSFRDPGLAQGGQEFREQNFVATELASAGLAHVVPAGVLR